MIQAKLTSKGQITIPKQIRERLGLHTGDRLVFILNRNGEVILTAQTSDVRECFGIIKSKKKLTSLDIKKAVASHAVRRFINAGR